MEEFQSKYTYVTDNKYAPRVNPKPPISYFAQNNLNNLQLLTHHCFPIKPYNTPLLHFQTPHPIFIPPTTSSIRIIQHLFLSPLFTLPLRFCDKIKSNNLGRTKRIEFFYFYFEETVYGCSDESVGEAVGFHGVECCVHSRFSSWREEKND